jgi:hypothetical protein
MKDITSFIADCLEMEKKVQLIFKFLVITSNAVSNIFCFLNNKINFSKLMEYPLISVVILFAGKDCFVIMESDFQSGNILFMDDMTLSASSYGRRIVVIVIFNPMLSAYSLFQWLISFKLSFKRMVQTIN